MRALQRGGPLSRVWPAAAIVAASVLFAAPAGAQTWPVRPIRLIVSQAPGGTPDIVARIVAERLTPALGQPVFVENHPGQANIAGALAAARSAGDGYSLFLGSTAAIVVNAYTFKALPYDPVRDFAPVAMVGKVVFILLANRQLAANSTQELIALAKARPGVINAATEGPRNFTGMVVSWFDRMAGTRLQQVPYRSQPQGVQDTIAGRTDLVVLAIPAARPLLQQGSLKPIGTTAARRLPGLEGVPALAETLPGFDFGGWFALFAPAATPSDPIATVNRAMRDVLAEPGLVSRLRQLGLYAETVGPPQSLASFVSGERSQWRELVARIGIEPE